MPFVRRYTQTPSDDTMLQIEGLVIVDTAPPSVVTGASSNEIFLAAEFLKGPYETPTRCNNQSTLYSTFGTFSPYSNPGGERPAPGNPPSLPLNGNGAFAVYGEKHGPVVACRVEDRVGTCSIVVTSNEISAGVYADPVDMTIPAGLRVSDADDSDIFALCDDVKILASDFTGNGPYVATKTLQAIRRVLGSASTVTLTKCPTPDAAHVENFTISASTASAIVDIDAAAMITNYEDAIALAKSSLEDNRNISMVVSARHDASDDAIFTALKDAAVSRSSNGKGCVAVIAPALNTAKATVIASSGVGVGNAAFSRNDRVFYVWPGMQKVISPLKSLAITKTQTTTGLINWPADFHLCALMSQINPEINPGIQHPDNAIVRGIEVGSNIESFEIEDYIDFKAAGIVALRMDPAGPEFQSGITSVNPALFSTRKNISTRRMRDYIQDSLAVAWGPYVKQLMTDQWKEDLFDITDDFLRNLKNDGRIKAYAIDTSINTADQEALGLWFMGIQVTLVPNNEVIVFQGEIGETVEIEEVA